MRHLFWRTDTDGRVALTADLIARHRSAIVFCRTKHGADRLVKQLGQAGVPAVAIHGNRTQPQRERALQPVLLGFGESAGRHRRGRSRHPRRCRGLRGALRSAGRPQGLRPPLRAHRASGRGRHRRHSREARAGPRRCSRSSGRSAWPRASCGQRRRRSVSGCPWRRRGRPRHRRRSLRASRRARVRLGAKVSLVAPVRRGGRVSGMDAGGVQPPMRPAVRPSGAAGRPDRTARISATIDTADSAGERAPRSRPVGPW